MTKSFEEIECKFLGIDPLLIENKLATLGAKRHYKKLFRRYVFDFPDYRLNSQKSWLRVRDEGDKVVMTYKQRKGVKKGTHDSGMREIEIEVSDFENSAALLRAIGMRPKFYEENWRTLYTLGNVEFSIDEWPLIPPYLEIEGRSWQAVDAMVKKLGFNPTEKFICSTMQVYEHYDINENDYTVLTFDKHEKVKKVK